MYGSAYVKQLQARVEAQRVQEESDCSERAQALTKAARERLTPLETRVARMLEDIPNELQQEGLSLPALQAALRGRQGGKAHAGELAAELRRLGFRRERRWRGDDGFQAFWRKQG